MERKEQLRIIHYDGRYEVKMEGSSDDILVMWAMLTTDMCEKLRINPVQLGFNLPNIVYNTTQHIQNQPPVERGPEENG